MTGTRQSFQECSPYSRLVTVYNVRTRCFETILIRHLYGETVPMVSRGTSYSGNTLPRLTRSHYPKKSGVCADIVMSERPYISFTIGHETTNQGKGGGGGNWCRGLGSEDSPHHEKPCGSHHFTLFRGCSYPVCCWKLRCLFLQLLLGEHRILRHGLCQGLANKHRFKLVNDE